MHADWRVYLATGGVRVDINNDGDYENFGDIVIGSSTSADTTDRLLVGKVVEITIQGQSFKLEVGAGANTKGIAEAFNTARPAAGG